MKQFLALLLIAALLLTAGCSGSDAAPETTAASGTVPVLTEPARSTEPADTEPASPPETEAPTTPDTEAPTEPGTEESSQAPSTEPVPTEQTTAEPDPVETVDPWSLIGELSFVQGSYTDDVGNSYTYSYDLPCIKAETPGAKAINEDIEEIFGGAVQNSMQEMEDGLSLYLLDTGFHGVVWEDVLTLVISTHTNWGTGDYGIYSYEVGTGRWLSTRDVLDRLGYSEEEFLDACRRQFRQFFIDENSSIPENLRKQYGYYDALEQVDSELYVSMDLAAFPSETGDLVVAAPIVSLAGAAFYWHLIYLGMGSVG